MERARYASELDDTRSRGRLWRIAAFSMIAANVLLSIKVFSADTREKTIVVPPIPYTEFWVKGNEISPNYLEAMARYFTGLMLTYDPASFESQKDIVLRYADPLAHAGLDTKFMEDGERIKRNSISEVFYPSETRIRAAALEVAFTGDVVTLIGQARAEPKRSTYVVRFANRNGQLFVVSFNEAPNESDPFGDNVIDQPATAASTSHGD